MNLAFSTLSCPEWTLDEILRVASENGYGGVEIRGIGENVDLRAVPDLTPENRASVRARFANVGVKICGLGSSARFAAPETRAPSRDEVKEYIELAADLGCPLVRIFGGYIPEGMDRGEVSLAVAEELNALAPFARSHGVGIVLETHDSFSTGADAEAVLKHVERDAIGAIWDMAHPFHQGEAPETTYSLLRPYVRHAHVKDSVGEEYTFLGEGAVPILEMLRLLFSSPLEHAVFVSVEWEKRWIPTLAPPEEVLPQYAEVLKEYAEKLGV